MPSIVVLTGAGISKESGLDTFRDAGGIWSTVRIDDVATPDAFRRDPARVQAFYNTRRRALLNPAVQPNPAHRALAHLEQAWRDPVLLVTQNVDDLHDRAGSRNLIHMHGELLKARCGFCKHVADITADITDDLQCRGCGRAGALRPHVVWFGEMPLELERIDEALAACALFISIGTSGTVYPAASYVRTARAAGARTVELNLEPSEGSFLFDEAIHGPASTIVPDFITRLLAEPR
jgi:NAD-dependent deacetylase